MKRSIVVLTIMLFATSVSAGEWSGNANFLLGQKSLDEEDWKPFENQAAFGVLIDFKRKTWPVSIAIDSLGSADAQTISGVEEEGITSEFDVGIRKIWEAKGRSIKPYVGGGIAFVMAEKSSRTGFTTISDDDTGTGIWLNGGVYWTIGRHFNAGLEARYSKAEVRLFNEDIEAGGVQGGLILGYHW